MKRLRRTASVLEAVLALAGAALRLRLLPFRRLRTSVLERPAPDLVFGSRRRQAVREVRSAVLAAERLLPWKHTCFQRSLACLILLRRRGINPQLHYGVRRTAGEDRTDGGEAPWEGHVWVTDGDRPVIGVRGAPRPHHLATLAPQARPRGVAILVLGIPRSGTSALAAGLSALGVELGPRLRGPAPFNPKGLFEDHEAAAINAELLRRVGSGPFSARLPGPRHWRSPEFDDLRRIASALAVSRFGRVALWGFKDPRTIHTLHFWIEVLEQAGYQVRFALAVRHPAAVAASLAKAFGVKRRQALRLWLAGAVGMLAAAARHPAVLIDYDTLVTYPVPTLRRLADALGLEEDAAALRSYVEEFLDARLRHHGVSGLVYEGALPVSCAGLWWAMTRLGPRRLRWLGRLARPGRMVLTAVCRPRRLVRQDGVAESGAGPAGERV
ncbi:MAG: hypothetical protein Kow001_00650 [Acidobacteriota bacterium]